MSAAAMGGAGATWPADVIHVNEDGWVLVNRGRSLGVVLGLRLLVVGSGIRELRDLFFAEDNGNGSASDREQPVALRIRRTYEQLEVVYVEDTCAIAIATRTPPQRRPNFFRGPDGELLVWVPLPEGFTYPQPGTSPRPARAEVEASGTGDYRANDDDDDMNSEVTNAESASDEENDGEIPDMPPEHGEQEDERWEEALPLNGVAVGDLVVPAIPVGNAASGTVSGGAGAPASSTGEPATNPFESGRNYDWMRSQD